jgi:PEP-CTERM motif-containing protein
MIRKYGKATAFAAIVMLALAGLSKGDSLNVTLGQSTQTVLQGTTVVTFTGTILNPSSTDTVFLNADSSVTSSGLVSVDDSPFLLNPLLMSLNPLQSSGSVLLFNIELPTNLTAGLYTGAFLILGGPDGGAFSDFSDLADVNFAVDVTSPVVATPEPGTILLLTSGLAGLGLLRKRARLASAS